jgi:predicted HAD superfamily Cof-like phosphohydrolase
MTNFDKVKTFSKAAVEAKGGAIPLNPTVMTKAETEFITKMVMDEMMELLCTTHTFIERVAFMADLADNINYLTTGDRVDLRLIAEQADTLVDASYYIMDTAARKNIPFDECFSEVARANLSKLDSDGKPFAISDEGKVLKPADFMAPDIESVIAKHLN